MIKNLFTSVIALLPYMLQAQQDDNGQATGSVQQQPGSDSTTNGLQKKEPDNRDAKSLGVWAYRYQHGAGVQQNTDSALSLYNAAATKGDAYSMINLGTLYFYGTNVAQDYTIAGQYFKAAASAGNPTAYCWLGYMYQTGIGLPIKLDSALHYYRQGAAAGHAHSLYSLGSMYYAGKGTKASLYLAAQYFLQAAIKGDAQAMAQVGAMYASGTWFARNNDSATYYLGLARKAGVRTTASLVDSGQVYQNRLNGQPQDFEKAATFYKMAAADGDANAASLLAYMYYKGLGLPQSYDSAYSIFKVLAEKGDGNAMFFVGLCHRNGYGTPVNEPLAMQWLTKAVAAGEQQAQVEISNLLPPENTEMFNPAIKAVANKIKAYTEPFATAKTNNISGKYKGYAIYYDFSRKHVLDVATLELDITQSNGKYKGVWAEDSGITTTPIIAQLDGRGTLSFDTGSHYTRYKRYNYNHPEKYRLENADLKVKYMRDSMWLAGDMHFYSTDRMEPGQPVYILLGRKIQGVNAGKTMAVNLLLSPNPANTTIRAKVSIDKPSTVQLQLIGIGGAILQQTTAKQLPAGSYSYTFNVSGLATGSYFVKLLTPSHTQTKQFLKQ